MFANSALGDSEIGWVEAPGPGIDEWAGGGYVLLHPVLGGWSNPPSMWLPWGAGVHRSTCVLL